MINFNTGSSYLQNQIISGFDSVAQGFTTTGSTNSLTGLQAALDSFSSFEAMNLTGLGSDQLIAKAGEFSNPATYFNSQLVGSVIQKEDPLLSALQDSNLSIGAELSNVSSILSNFASSNSFPLANATAAMGIVIEERKGAEATATKGPLANATAAMGIVIEERKGTEATATKGPLANATAAMGIVIEERKGTEATATSPLANATAAMGIVIEERKGTEATATKGPLANATAAMGIVIEERKGTEAAATKGPLADATAAMGIIIEERNLTTFANMSESVRKAANLYQAANLSMLSKQITS